MGWKEFFASVINSLAWPAAIAFIVFLLRQHKVVHRVVRNQAPLTRSFQSETDQARGGRAANGSGYVIASAAAAGPGMVSQIAFRCCCA
jgi:hypothetical protein